MIMESVSSQLSDIVKERAGKMETIESLKTENAMLKERIWDLKDELQGIAKFTRDGASVDGETQKAVSLALARMFIDNGAVNYLTLTIRHENDEYELTMQKKGKLTPAEKASILQEKLDALKQYLSEASLAEWKERSKCTDIADMYYHEGRATAYSTVKQIISSQS